MEEFIDIINEKDKVIKKVTRKEIVEKALLHRASRVIIINNNEEFLVQKRSKNKDLYPNHYDVGIGETVKSGESYEAAAIRGLKEELGITNISNIQLIHSFLFKIKYNSKKHNSYYKVYELQYNGKLRLQQEEIQNVKFLTIENIKKDMRKKLFHPGGTMVFKKYLNLKIRKL